MLITEFSCLTHTENISSTFRMKFKTCSLAYKFPLPFHLYSACFSYQSLYSNHQHLLKVHLKDKIYLKVFYCCFAIVQLWSCVQFSVTMNCSTPVFSQRFLRFMSIESMMLSNHFNSCCPYLLFSLNLCQHQGLFQWDISK